MDRSTDLLCWFLCHAGRHRSQRIRDVLSVHGYVAEVILLLLSLIFRSIRESSRTIPRCDGIHSNTEPNSRSPALGGISGTKCQFSKSLLHTSHRLANVFCSSLESNPLRSILPSRTLTSPSESDSDERLPQPFSREDLAEGQTIW